MENQSLPNLPGGHDALKAVFPLLAERLPHLPLGNFPTPVRRLHPGYGCDGLYLKDDSQSGPVYGGNKIRKLEYLLGQARQEGAARVLTYGAAGSNHALATAIYAARTGFRPEAVLLPQLNAGYVRRNLLAHLTVPTRLYPVAGKPLRRGRSRRIFGRGRLFEIPFGGTNLTGSTGFVAAALEIGEQVAAGLLPEPDYCYAPLGSMGTVAGLMVGFRALGMRTKVIGVRVVPPFLSGRHALAELCTDLAAWLHGLDPLFPLQQWPESRVTVDDRFFGGEYARFTEAGMQAVAEAARMGFHLEGCYSGKAFAALLQDMQDRKLGGKQVLFWNTVNSRVLPSPVESEAWRRLPLRLQRYFKEPLQPLDLLS